MKICKSEIIGHFTPSAGNPRNSEGDFVRLPDGNIMFAYSRMTAGLSDDAVSDIAAIRLSADGRKILPGEPVVLVAHGEYKNCLNLMSVSFVTLNSGEIALFYLVRRQEECSDEYGRKNRDSTEF